MAWTYDLYQLVGHLLRPYTLFMLLLGLALVNLWRRCRYSRRAVMVVILPFVALMSISLPAVSYVALWTLEWRYPPRETRPTRAGAIVVLSGGVKRADAVRLREELSDTSRARCLHAAEVYHQGPPMPVVVSGGIVDPRTVGRPEGELMRDLLQTLGVKEADLIVEDGSRTTYENALESRRLLERLGIREIILVTEASHMLRAVLCFRNQGLVVMPSACRHGATQFDWSISGFLPNSDAASDCAVAAYEWLGLAWYWLHGRI